MIGLFLIFCGLFLLLALFSFDANDPSLNYVKSGSHTVHNKAGLFGAYASGLLNDFFGIGALLWPSILIVLGAAHVASSITLHWWRWSGFFLLTVCLLVVAASLDVSIGDLTGGGMVGQSILTNSVKYLSPFGSFLLFAFIFLAGLQLAANFSWLGLLQACKVKITQWKAIYHRGSHEASGSSNLRQAALKVSGMADGLITAIRSRSAQWRDLLGGIPEKITIAFQNRLGRRERGELKVNLGEGAAVPPQIGYPPRLVPDEDQVVNPEDMRKGEQELAISLQSASPAESHSHEMAEELGGAEEDKEACNDGILPDSLLKPISREVPAEQTEWKQPEIVQAPATLQPAPSTVPEFKLFREDVAPQLPGPELLVPPAPVRAASSEDLEGKGRALMTCFNDFGIQGELARITPGPVVTMFEVRPAAGIRVSRIANLADDLSLALKAVAVRIQAPIPGSDTVGIEIPNESRQMVNFRELVECEEFQKSSGPLGMILGKNIAGFPFLADLTRMPHMLVAGATGAGKSVCLNSILVSLLYRVTPRDMRLLLIDPKRIELAVYADLPHLVHPVVTEMDDAKNALEWAVQDMKNRYKTFERLGVRNIIAYHQKLASFGNAVPPELQDLGHMPYLVIVIDELADLMMTAAREVETSIVRLAQLARAAGIHMILATQRPSVDVVTGLIKANFPCRISFQVTSKHDSRTILDQVGAEHLLGRGDMLFKPSGGKLIRLHGPFLSDDEVQTVVNHWKDQLPPDYQIDFSQWSGEGSPSPGAGSSDSNMDPLYNEARDFVLQQGRASISLLQRHLKIGFNRAARLVEQFEKDGIVGPPDGSKPRNVIK